ncbi:MAG: acetyl-CoA carboxylase carboxyltransferase subunit alpha [Candidatus Omnitrophota bacterium]
MSLDFEKPIVELERKIEELKKFSSTQKLDISSEIKKLEEKLEKVKRDVFSSLTPWQRVQIARHPKRPYTLDYIRMITTDFIELHGDRHFADDKALICGFARIDGEKVFIIGHQKGRDTKENLMRLFGMPHPEGYRKALRLMELAARAGAPIVCFVDTPGAYPGIGAEERGQAEAIAYNLQEMFMLRVPIVVTVIGEGGSGGALGIAVGDRICVLENAYYSVISPEGCAAILWKDRKKAADAAKVLKMTGEELLRMGIIDEVVKEPLGGAHRDPEETARTIKETIKKHIVALKELAPEKLIEERYKKFRAMGVFSEPASEKVKN